MADGSFDDLLDANTRYVDSFGLAGLEPRAARGLAVLTCIDSRIEPLAMLGLAPGDAKILRNAGARVTDDMLRTLVLAVHLLGVDRIAIVHHTNCRMVGVTDDELRVNLAAETGVDTTDWDFHAVPDQSAVVADDLAALRACPLLPNDLPVAAFLYHVETGRLTPFPAPTT
ncbi:MAG: carbonic anhydrase [Acidimicrobiia bacterium]|nr:carbonic anhydrase [Acidimicrobiia bacterium]